MLLPVAFAGGETGAWRLERIEAVVGVSLPNVSRVDMVEGQRAITAGSTWILRGVTSSQHYTRRTEHEALAAKQPHLGRPEATCAALIPITKSAAWWGLAQDERREIFEERSHHIAVGLEYLPEVARRLHHGRDLGEEFDFLTWFEYPEESAAAFDELVSRLRATPEWEFVEREIDMRLRLAPSSAHGVGRVGEEIEENASEVDAEAWRRVPLDEGEQSLFEVAEWDGGGLVRLD